MDAEVLPEWIPDEEVSQVSELPSFIEKKTHGSEHHLLRSIGRTDQNRSARQKAVVAAAALLVGATALCVALVASKGATSPLPPQMPFSDAGGLQAWLQLQSNVTRIFAVHIESVAAGSVADVHAGQLSAVADAFAAAAHVSSSAVAITIAPSSVRLTVDILCVSRAAAIAVAALLAPLLSSGAGMGAIPLTLLNAPSLEGGGQLCWQPGGPEWSAVPGDVQAAHDAAAATLQLSWLFTMPPSGSLAFAWLPGGAEGGGCGNLT